MNFLFKLAFISIFFAGCSKQLPAPIEYNYNKNNNARSYNDNKIISSPLESIPHHVPTSHLEFNDELSEGRRTEEMKTIYHDVTADENLSIIAQNYDKNVEELASLNNISPNAKLSEGQVIKINVSKKYLNNLNNKDSNSTMTLETVEENDRSKPKTSSGSFIRPVDGRITAKFGDTLEGKVKTGITIDAEEGTNIRAAGDGIVIHTEHNKEFGNLAIIKLKGTNTSVAYAYMQDLNLKKGQEIKKGETIGRVGMTGKTSKSQLYFAVREGSKAVDPEKYIDK